MEIMSSSFVNIIESFYIETQEGLFFAAKGLVHPDDRIIAILRYVPDPDGGRSRNGRSYRRYYHFTEQTQLLRSEYPQYLTFDTYAQTTLQSVPHQHIRRVYDPRLRLLEISHHDQRDHLEADTLAFAQLLQAESGVDFSCLGVTGSLLIGLQTPGSDLDMTVHGEQNCRRIHRALKRLLSSNEYPEIRPFDSAGFEKLYQERVADTHMDYQDFLASEKGKSFQGTFRGRTFFIRFLKEPSQVSRRYGDFHYKPLGKAGIHARVTDSSEAIFTPCRYELAEVHFDRGTPVKALSEIVSFRGRFCEQAQAGERIRAYGTLEQVQAQDGRTWYRLLLGNHPEDIMLSRR
jgi:predicted nucleotidyltransferase